MLTVLFADRTPQGDSKAVRTVHSNGMYYMELTNFNTVHAIGRSKVTTTDLLNASYRRYLAERLLDSLFYIKDRDFDRPRVLADWPSPQEPVDGCHVVRLHHAFGSYGASRQFVASP